MSETAEGRDSQEILKNFKYEMSLNLGVVRPTPGTRNCSSEFRIDYFRNNQDKLSKLSGDLADRLRAVYGKMEEENRYIRLLLELGYDRFRFDHPNEFSRWNTLCTELLADIQWFEQKLGVITNSSHNSQLLEIFVSYSAKDRAVAARVANLIRLGGAEAFLAHETIEVSAEWRSEILKHLRQCSAIFCLITKNFLESEWTQQEAAFAMARGVKVVPLLFNELRAPGFIETFQGKRVTDNNLERIVNESVQGIKTSLAATEKSSVAAELSETISGLGWQVLEAAKGSSGTVIATTEIAKAIGKDNAVVYDECVVLRDFGYVRFTDDSHGMALLKITGQGLHALRNKPRH